MNYPVWELTNLNGGTLVAIISVLHAYIAHLAVGGGFFLWLTDLKGFRDDNPLIHEYLRGYTRFFLLLTMVFGAVSGVGIWFIILLVNPSATSVLIHHFVFAWAIEWVFFLGEITALLIYHHQFNTLEPRHRLNIAFLYFLFAWLSMVVINGILSFMLTPGDWLDTHDFWDGFLNPTFLPSLLFRMSAACLIAGLFGQVTTMFGKGRTFRDAMMRYCAKWVLFPVPALVISGIWYYYSIPESARITNFHVGPQTALPLGIFLIAFVLLFVGGIFLLFKSRPTLQKGIVVILLFIGLGWYGGFEYMREYARKPYIIYNYMYSNSILKKDIDTLNSEGVLKHARWSAIKEVIDDNVMEAGRDIFFLECAVCHTIGGTKNDIIAKTGDLTYMGMLSQLTGQGKVLGYMPPFAGTDKEKEALAAYIIGELHHKEIIAEPAAFDPLPSNNRISPFDPEHDEYLLLVWNDLGMHCITDSSPWFIMLPPANTLEAQLIRRGTRPELVSDGVELRYRVEDGFKNPSRHVNFWKYAKHYFGTHLEENIGVAGNGMNGSFHFEPARNGFIAEMIPVVPYKDDGSFNSYPQFYVEARDKSSGTVLAFTKVVAPTSTEMGCRHCHGGRWRVNDVAGISDETAANVLRTHDRNQGTDLYTRALEGKPTLCQSCHPDPVLGAAGKPGHNNLPASIHGWHANYMYLEGAAACAMCHPAAANGATRCNRGVHAALHMNCTDCHGTLGDHAIALLKNQTGNESTARLLSNLETVAVKTPSEVQPRTPWIQEPDCVSCHVNFRKPSTMASYNQWNDNASQLYRIRTDQTGMRCIACHNSTHSEYPATNPYGTDRDNTQPLQYMGIPLPVGSESTCSACHTREMPLSGHHPNMVRPFRNRSITALK